MRLRRYHIWWIKATCIAFLIMGMLYYMSRSNASGQDYSAEVDAILVQEPIGKLPYIREEEKSNERRQFNDILSRDWHDYTYMRLEQQQKGPGENGQAYFLPTGLEAEKDLIFKVNGFNGRASDDIAINRSLSDIRHPKCKDKKYQGTLPTTSVIVPFYNEHWSTLLRTVTSVINRSPSELLVEVILVDDGSSKEFLKQKLELYVKDHFTKVKIIRLDKREGLISARLAGAKIAKGETLVFLDSHTECATNWLPPLLSPIAKDYKTCVCPFIDVIDYDNFAYRAQDDGARGAFDWQLFYKRLPILQQDKDNMPEPFKSPVMAGGLFAIDANFFWELGGYDPGIKIWGGEQYELSFKVWQCGGTMVDAPCSRVGHIYRKFSPFSHAGGNYLARNHKRVAEVWMDEYASYVYKHSPHMLRVDPGDINEQKAIRERLKCKSFRWFMKEVAFDLMKVYPPVEPPDFANGTIKSKANTELCVDTKYRGHEQRFGLEPCSYGGNQRFTLTWRKDIRADKRTLCWDVSNPDEGAPVLLYNCHGAGGNQFWKYDPKTENLYHGMNVRCLDSNPNGLDIFVSACDPEKLSQKWMFEFLDPKYLENWDKEIDLAF